MKGENFLNCTHFFTFYSFSLQNKIRSNSGQTSNLKSPYAEMTEAIEYVSEWPPPEDQGPEKEAPTSNENEKELSTGSPSCLKRRHCSPDIGEEKQAKFEAIIEDKIGEKESSKSFEAVECLKDGRKEAWKSLAQHELYDEDDESEVSTSVDALVALWYKKNRVKLSETTKNYSLGEDKDIPTFKGRSPKSIIAILKRSQQGQNFLKLERSRVLKELEATGTKFQKSGGLRTYKKREFRKRFLSIKLAYEIDSETNLQRENNDIFENLLKDMRFEDRMGGIELGDIVPQSGNYFAGCVASHKKYLATIQELSDFEKEVLWWSFKMDFAQSLNSIPFHPFSPRLLCDEEYGEVERVSHKELTVQRFKSDYCAKGIPVIVTGLNIMSRDPKKTHDNCPAPWTLTHISKVAGHRRVTLKRFDPFSTEWAGLEEEPQLTTLADFAKNVEEGRGEGQYLFDVSLPLYLPELYEELQTPDYVADDYLKRTSEGALYRKSWPSLFVSGKGTPGGQTHVDAFGSHFWMYLFSGCKKWTFCRAEEMMKLGPRFHNDSLDPVFDRQLNNKEINFKGKRTVILRPGEWLFVPSGSPHMVENLEPSIAVSGNFVNETNIMETEKHLRVNALRDPGAGRLLRELVDLGLTRGPPHRN